MLSQGTLTYTNGAVLKVSRPQSNKLQTRSLQNMTMPEPRTIEVTNLTKEISTDQLSLYFENNRKSGGGSVVDVTKQGDKSAYVTFENPSGMLIH